MNSCLYTGTVRHRRVADVDHTFIYRQSLLHLDLDEAPSLLRRARLWSAKRPAPGWFRRSDYLGDPRVPLADAVRDTVADATGVRPDGRVSVLTHARTFGHCFNPLTLYFCRDADDTQTTAIVCEVANTPWGERHSYVIDRGDRTGPVLRGEFDKRFHVSPFMGMDHTYDIRVSEPGEQLSVHIVSTRDGALAFDATLALTRAPISPRALDRELLRRPVETLRTVVLIYANALRLKLKGAPYHPHPAKETR